MSRYLPILALSFILVYMPGCSTEGCDEEMKVNLRSTLYESGTGEPVVMDSITIYGLNSPDTTLYLLDEMDEVNLPLDPTGTSSIFIIQSGLDIDTFEVSYTSYPHFVSKSCGYIYLFELDDITYTSSGIDTVLIINSLVRNTDEENIRTFF